MEVALEGEVLQMEGLEEWKGRMGKFLVVGEAQVLTPPQV